MQKAQNKKAQGRFIFFYIKYMKKLAVNTNMNITKKHKKRTLCNERQSMSRKVLCVSK